MRAHPPGSPLVVRTVTRGRVRWAAPATAVCDDAATIAYYRPPGSTVMVTEGSLWRAGESREQRECRLRQELLDDNWTLVEHTTSSRRGSLVVSRPGDWFAVRLVPDEAGSYIPAYVNIQRPLQRTPSGYDTDDLCLDLIVGADGSVTVKDADEFEGRYAAGIYSREERDAAFNACDTAIALLRPDTSFFAAWRTWRPVVGVQPG